MRYEETEGFARDFRKLLKKFPTLSDDLSVAKKNAIELFHIRAIDNRSVFEIKGAGNTKELKFYKVKKFACKSLKGRGVQSGVRVTYAYFPDEQKVVFLEVYFKGNKENEDRRRIEDFIRTNP